MKPDSKKVIAIQSKLPDKYKNVSLTDDDFVDALYALLFRKDLPVITIMGPGGTGKSFMYKLYSSIYDNVLCTATTGIAAFNLSNDDIYACTLHSALNLKAYPWYNDEKIRPQLVKILEDFSDLFIDEVSMLNANLLDYILAHVEEANKRKNKKRQDKLRVVLFGDTLQLPPVIKDTDKNIRKLWKDGYDNQYMFYKAKRFKKLAKKDSFFFLDEVFSQSDRQFKAILNEIRFASPTQNTLDILNQHVCTYSRFASSTGKSGMMYLTMTNHAVDKYNNLISDKHVNDQTEHHTYIAESSGDPDWDYYFNNIKHCVELYKGQQVMCIANNPDEGYQNGTVGVIQSFTKPENSKEYLPVVKTKDGRIFTVARKTFTEYKIEKVVKGHPYEPVIKGEVTQIGCRVAYASTVHKAQGLTLNAVYFDPTKKPMPNSVYVALSRLKSLDGLGLKRKLTADDIIITDESVELYKEFNAMEPD